MKYFPDLKMSELYFLKLHPGGAELIVKNESSYLLAQVDSSADGVFFKYDVSDIQND